MLAIGGACSWCRYWKTSDVWCAWGLQWVQLFCPHHASSAVFTGRWSATRNQQHDRLALLFVIWSQWVKLWAVNGDWQQFGQSEPHQSTCLQHKPVHIAYTQISRDCWVPHGLSVGKVMKSLNKQEKSVKCHDSAITNIDFGSLFLSHFSVFTLGWAYTLYT